MPYDGNHLVVTKANAIVEASYRLTLQEQRVVLYCVAQVDSRAPLDEQRCFVVEAGPFRQIYGIAQEKVYEELKDAGKRLFERKISLVDRDTNHVTLLRWVSLVRYHKRQGRMTLHFSPELLPFISELRARFTSYPLSAVAALSTSFAIRLFEILAQYRTLKKRVVSVDQLRLWLDCTETFKRFTDFDRWVIRPSIEQINERTMLNVQAERRKSGRQVTEIEFQIGEDKDWERASSKEQGAGTDRKGALDEIAKPGAGTQRDLQSAQVRHEQAIGQVHPLLRHFFGRVLGPGSESVSFVSAAEKAFADELAATLGTIDAAKAFVDFAVDEAQRSNFNVKTLRGLAQYVPFWQAQQGRAVIEQPCGETGGEAERTEIPMTLPADQDQRQRVQNYIDGLDDERRRALTMEALAQIEADHPPSAMTHRLMLDLTIRRLAKERLADDVEESNTL